MNGIGLLKNIAALLVEILLLLIFVPKTIFKILKDPKWVTHYFIDHTKDGNENKDYVSPVLLYLITALVPVVLFPAGKVLVSLTDLNDFTGELTSAQTFFKGALYMGIPLSVAFVLTLIKDRRLDRSVLEKYIFIQCYYLAPLLLVVQLRWVLEVSGLCIWNLSLHSLVIPVLFLTVIWLLVVQAYYIHNVLRLNLWKTVFAILISSGLIFVITDSIAFKVIPGTLSGDGERIGFLLVVLVSLFFGIALVKWGFSLYNERHSE